MFKDINGTEWSPSLNFAKLDTIRTKAKVDLGDVEKLGHTWARILSDDALALKVVWLSIDADMTEQEWLAAMDGECLQQAVESLLDAIKLFTRPAKRGMIEEGAAAVHRAYLQAISQAEAEIRKATLETTENARQALGTVPPK
jgi:hypothetical protein